MEHATPQNLKKKEPIPIEVWSRCWQVMLEMLGDRGWTHLVPSASVETLHTQYLHAKSLVVLLLSATAQSPSLGCSFCGADECKLSVFICLSGNFTSPAMQHIETLRHGIGHLLVLFQDKVTATLREDFFRPQRYELELKHFAQLYVNVARHRLVPPHRRLSLAEESEILDKYRCAKNKFPSILVTDPVVRYYNFPVGSLIEIQRPYVYYRHVVLAAAKTNYEKFFSD
jgi:DNA-directed RNA polymerase I, II, and III subunit RPABC1